MNMTPISSVNITEISNRIGVSSRQVEAVVSLLSDGATVPFIARYRKEVTGALDEVVIESIRLQMERLQELDVRKSYIKGAIKKLGKLTPELEISIDLCRDERLLEDIYLPYKSGRRTRAAVARSRGLEPLAKIIMAQRAEDLFRTASRFIGEGVECASDALTGASDIIAEWINESDRARSIVRRLFHSSAIIKSKVIKGKETEGETYKDYFDFSEPLRGCSSHRYLAMRRGEVEGILRVNIEIDDDEAIRRLCGCFIKCDASDETANVVRSSVIDGYKRLLRPSIENEAAAEAKLRSDEAAIGIFADGLRQILMAPPLAGRRILGIDPGYRTGCKVVCIDEQGNLLAHDVIFPCAPVQDVGAAERKLLKLHALYGYDTIALGNGTASRPTWDFLQGIKFPLPVEIRTVSEQGASIYSASEIARKEFPDEDITVRGAVSIARRLLDPLAELVKIDPKSIGVGQYQHDVSKQMLSRSLDFIVESCVNQVGVNINTASVPLLSYVAGIGPSLAENIVRYRSENGPFSSRVQIKNVPRMGDKAYQQCSGFLMVPGSVNPLDNTRIHPECYKLVNKMARDVGVHVSELVGNERVIGALELTRYQSEGAGEFTLQDILEELKKPGRDPRAVPENIVFNDKVREFSDISVGMVLQGRVCNITAFGAFVEIGIKETGLIHISQLSDRFVSSVSNVVKIGQIVTVRVIEIDHRRKRISLTMKSV